MPSSCSCCSRASSGWRCQLLAPAAKALGLLAVPRLAVSALFTLGCMAALLMWLVAAPACHDEGGVGAAGRPPASQLQATVVLLNWQRSDYVQHHLLPVLLAHPGIGQVVVSHGRRDRSGLFAMQHPKLLQVDDTDRNAELGLSLRFHRCHEHATHEAVIHLDDDTELSLSAIDRLLEAYANNPTRISGPVARKLRWNYFYASEKSACNAPVVLTKLMIMPRRLCRHFLNFAPHVLDLAHQGTPRWNGEDIFMSLVAGHVLGTGPDAAQQQHHARLTTLSDVRWPAVGNAGSAISGNLDDTSVFSLEWWQRVGKAHTHKSHRTALWKAAAARLARLPRFVSAARTPTCVFTGVFGQFDVLRPMQLELETPPHVRYFVLSDSNATLERVPAPWEPLLVPTISTEPRRNARHYKILPAPLWDKCNVSIYIDGNVELLVQPSQIVATLAAGADLGIARHPFCRDYACELSTRALASPQSFRAIQLQVEDYERNSGFDRSARAYESSLLVRRHTPQVRKLMERWRQDVMRHEHLRDQISLAPVLHASGVQAFVPWSPEHDVDAEEKEEAELQARRVHARPLRVQGLAAHNVLLRKRCHRRAMGQELHPVLHQAYCAVYSLAKVHLPHLEANYVESHNWYQLLHQDAGWARCALVLGLLCVDYAVLVALSAERVYAAAHRQLERWGLGPPWLTMADVLLIFLFIQSGVAVFSLLFVVCGLLYSYPFAAGAAGIAFFRMARELVWLQLFRTAVRACASRVYTRRPLAEWEQFWSSISLLLLRLAMVYPDLTEVLFALVFLLLCGVRWGLAALWSWGQH
eukprot:m.95523 g.95523  ORF g.95523 m.95523 type:complete len:812 (+) comp18431_c0_seq1:1-2436(+)